MRFVGKFMIASLGQGFAKMLILVSGRFLFATQASFFFQVVLSLTTIRILQGHVLGRPSGSHMWLNIIGNSPISRSMA